MLGGICVISLIARNHLSSVRVSLLLWFCKPYVTSKSSSMSTFWFFLTHWVLLKLGPSTENTSPLVKGTRAWIILEDKKGECQLVLSLWERTIWLGSKGSMKKGNLTEKGSLSRKKKEMLRLRGFKRNICTFLSNFAKASFDLRECL